MRLDVYLVEHQYFESRNKAANAVKEGNFTVNKKQVFKPSFEVSYGDNVCAIKKEKVYVARSAHKLLNAYRQFSLNWRGKVIADLGASTGGFCQVLLENEVRKIYAVDIGTAQLHPAVKMDSRIVNMEHTNARNLTAADFDAPIEGITADLSFISLKMVLPAVYNVLIEGGEAVVLIKPQFEAGPAHLSKSGVVADRKIHLQVIGDIASFAVSLGFSVGGIAFSGLTGESGNREYLMYLLKNGGDSFSIESAAKKAVYEEGEHA